MPESHFLGVCVPYICSASDIRNLFLKNYSFLNLVENDNGTALGHGYELYQDDYLDTSKPPTYQMSDAAWLCSCVVFVQVILVLIGTLIDFKRFDMGLIGPEA
jgi:hypothetical protein